jgi:hypothetical protein
MDEAVKELHVGLLKLNNPTYSSIDKLMRSLMKKYDLTAKELHYGFRDEHNDQTPDEWIKSQRTKKMKTFKEFLEEAHLYEMRKEDKVKGKGKTPMYLSLTSKKLEKTPEGGWKMKKTEYKRPNPDASIGRMRQGMTASPEDAPRNPGWGTERTTLRRQPHGSGGEQRGKKKVPGEKKERNWNTDGPSPQQKVEWKKAARANKGRDLLGYKRGY